MNQAAPSIENAQVKRFIAHLTEHARGRAHAKTAKEISRALGLGVHGDRILRALAHHATDDGIVVCTGNAGYWLPETEAEAEETIGRLRSQGVDMLQRADTLSKLVHQQFHPTQLKM